MNCLAEELNKTKLASMTKVYLTHRDWLFILQVNEKFLKLQSVDIGMV